MSKLTDFLLDHANEDNVVAALTDAVDAEVSSKSGVGGLAIKAAYATITKANPGVIARAIRSALPDIAGVLGPFWEDKGSMSFSEYLVANSEKASKAILSVIDAKAGSIDNKMIAKGYETFRGKADEEIAAALPRLGETLEKLIG